MDDLRGELRDFDPDAPLPGAPDPWDSTPMPAARPGPPFGMTESIAAQPALARRIVGRLVADGTAAALAAGIRAAAADGAPVILTGCGTSEHGALAAAEVLRAAWRTAGLKGEGPMAVQAFELALDPPARGLVVGISHEGATGATIGALEAARAGGCRTALVTASGRAPGARFADTVLETAELDRSWCHTIGYVSPIVVAATVAAFLAGREPAGDPIAARLAAGLDAAHAAAPDGTRPDAAIADRLSDAAHLLVIASGADRPAAREMVLKVEEGAWLPSAMRDLETFLHGHLPATGPSTGLVLILADPAGRDERVARARQALAAARLVGIRAAAILAAGAAAGIADGLTPAGRIVVPEAPDLPGPAAALLGTAGPLQLVTERLARARGTNPDPIRRDDARYRDAAAAAD